MSAETPKPQPGDVVQVTYKAVWDQDRGTHYWLRDLTDGTTASVPNTASVEVLERAEDADAPILGPGTYELTKRVHVGDDGRARFMDMPDGPLAEYVAGFWPKTRSWVRKVDSQGPSVRVPNEPHGLSAEVRAKIRRHIEDGDEDTAIVVAQNAGIVDARSYVEATWEYLNRHEETPPWERDLCRRDDCPAAPRCSSGATVWHDRTPECGDPS